MITLTHSSDCNCTVCNPTITPLPLLQTELIRGEDIRFEAHHVEFVDGEWYVLYTEHRKKLDLHIESRAMVRSWNSSCMLGKVRA